MIDLINQMDSKTPDLSIIEKQSEITIEKNIDAYYFILLSVLFKKSKTIFTKWDINAKLFKPQYGKI